MVDQVLKKAEQTGSPVEIIYLGDKGITQRVIEVRQFKKDKVIAFCRLRREVRYFNIENILSASIYSENEMDDLKKN